MTEKKDEGTFLYLSLRVLSAIATYRIISDLAPYTEILTYASER